MIWFTWRQLRVPTLIAATALAALGTALLVTSRTVTRLYADVAACSGDCTGQIATFLSRFADSVAAPVGLTALAAAYLLPGLLGVFWGAPLVSRELESGTYRLAWTQSVTRTRWLASKLSVGCAVAALSTGLLAWAVTTWYDRIVTAAQDGMVATLFGARGVVPVAYGIFAFVLGVTAGLVLRRVVPAMAATFGVYVAAVVAMPVWVRTHLAPTEQLTRPLTADVVLGTAVNTVTGGIEVVGREPDGVWTVANQIATPAGTPYAGPADLTQCGPDGSPQRCAEWLADQGLSQHLLVHPASQFWSLQWVEAGIFLAAAALLAALCFWWVRRRIG